MVPASAKPIAMPTGEELDRILSGGGDPREGAPPGPGEPDPPPAGTSSLPGGKISSTYVVPTASIDGEEYVGVGRFRPVGPGGDSGIEVRGDRIPVIGYDRQGGHAVISPVDALRVHRVRRDFKTAKAWSPEPLPGIRVADGTTDRMRRMGLSDVSLTEMYGRGLSTAVLDYAITGEGLGEHDRDNRSAIFDRALDEATRAEIGALRDSGDEDGALRRLIEADAGEGAQDLLDFVARDYMAAAKAVRRVTGDPHAKPGDPGTGEAYYEAMLTTAADALAKAGVDPEGLMGMYVLGTVRAELGTEGVFREDNHKGVQYAYSARKDLASPGAMGLSQLARARGRGAFHFTGDRLVRELASAIDIDYDADPGVVYRPDGSVAMAIVHLARVATDANGNIFEQATGKHPRGLKYREILAGLPAMETLLSGSARDDRRWVNPNDEHADAFPDHVREAFRDYARSKGLTVDRDTEMTLRDYTAVYGRS